LALWGGLEKALDGVFEKAPVGLEIRRAIITGSIGGTAIGAAGAAIQTYDHPCFHFTLISLNTL
jgi:hypothetical protein